MSSKQYLASSEEAGQSRSWNPMGFVTKKVTKTDKKLPTNSEELMESYEIFNGGGEQHSS